MNVVSIQFLAREIAKINGWSDKLSEKFVVEFFKTVQEGLLDSGNVSIKGIGQFKIEGKDNILFEADDKLAQQVNEPFECFEPIPLDVSDVNIISPTVDEKPNDDIEEKVDVAEIVNESDIAEEGDLIDDVLEEDRLTGVEITTTEPDDERIEEGVVEKSVEAVVDKPVMALEAEIEIVDDITADDEALNEIEVPRPRHRVRWFIFGLTAGIIVGAGCMWLFMSGIFGHGNNENINPNIAEVSEQSVNQVNNEINDNEGVIIETETVMPDSDNDNAEQEIDKPVVTETVSATNYLAAMARRHYGRYEFWVYIYDENADILDNPDNIAPKTVVVIPYPEKYGIDANDPESVRRANERSNEIYSRFKNR